MTTGALYKRYTGKEELFHAIVADTVVDLNEFVELRCDVPASSLSDEALIKAWVMDEEDMMSWFRLLYEHHDGFVLLIKCAEGTEYSNFQHDWVEKITAESCVYFLEAKRRGLTCADISREDMHFLLSAFWTTIYEPFIHGYTMEQIKKHSALVCKLFNWQNIFGFCSPK